MIFVVVPFIEPPKDFINRIRLIDPEPYISQSPRIYFVRSTGNSRFVADKIGFTDVGDYQDITGIVIPCDNSYSGYATSDLWDYLSGDK